MTGMSGIRLALTLGLALSLLVGAGTIVATPASPAPATTRDTSAASEPNMEPWPSEDALATEVSRYPGRDDPNNVTIALAARWGYLNDPAVIALAGRWQFNSTNTGGEFVGEWRLVNGRVVGTLHGRFTLPADGHGEFRGVWSLATARIGGALWGDWVRINATNGYFDGQWNMTGTSRGGALSGGWVQLRADGGGFRGRAIDAPTMDAVSWDGTLTTTDGAIRVVRPVRFERDDHVLPRTNRSSVDWVSTTTTNWDGIIFLLRLPRADPGLNVTLATPLASFTWSLRELAGLRVRETVDPAGHEIQVAGFVLGGPPATEYVRVQIGMRWGNLSSADGADALARDVTSWDGFAQITSGGLADVQAVSFERGDAILPRDNRVTVVWTSSTTTGWDGVRLVALVPLSQVDSTYFTVHAGPFTHVFSLRDLPGDHTFDAGNGGQVEVLATRA